jgi:hypothetical protein
MLYSCLLALILVGAVFLQSHVKLHNRAGAKYCYTALLPPINSFCPYKIISVNEGGVPLDHANKTNL